jgi:alanyl-tRNA synthetase
LSRAGGDLVFKCGLADHSEITTKYHTATHLLQKVLRMVLGDHIAQKGSNITHERMRFDFSHTSPLTKEQIAEVERIVNEQIKRDLPVKMEVMSLDEAKSSGAIALFGEKYESQVKVFSIGDFSKEVCGGPMWSAPEQWAPSKSKKSNPHHQACAGLGRFWLQGGCARQASR